MNIPMVNLKTQYQSIKIELQEAISKVLEEANFIMGPDVKLFEEEIAQYCGSLHAIGVGSGTEALHISLLACGINPKDEVIVPTFTFIATAEVVSIIGAKPVFADIDPNTFNISINDLKKKITPRTRCIIPVHLYGQPADMDKIQEIAKEHNLIIIEDCAQAMGAEWKGKKVGTLGDTGCFSFFPSKNLGGYGDGGMILTNRDDVAERARTIRVHGVKIKYFHHIIGFNSRLDTIQAAILRVKLKHLDKWNNARRKSAALYEKALENSSFTTPSVREDVKHVYHQYTIRTPMREKLQKFLKEKEISSMIYYPLCLHLQEAFNDLDFQKGDFPNAEKAQEEVISLPICPELSPDQIKYITENLLEFQNNVLKHAGTISIS